MKIVLVCPPLIQTDRAEELNAIGDADCVRLPVGIYTMGAILIEQGHDVVVCNQALTPWPRALEEIQSHRPDLIGITCMTRYRRVIEAMTEALRERMPDVRIALGGVHATLLWRSILERWSAVDFVAVGEGDQSFPELLRRLDADQSPWGIPGIASRREDGSIDWSGFAEPVEDLSALPVAARHFAYDTISTARGCPFACTFCSSPALWGRRVRQRSVEHIIEELELLRRRHGVRQVHFKDETFTVNRRCVIELCRAMVERDLGLWWTCDTRVDCVDAERLEWMRRAGCHHISFGIESGSPRVLASINKRTSPEEIRAATALAREFGFRVRYYLIGDLPGEEPEDVEATLDLVREGRPHDISINTLDLMPGTEITRQHFESRGLDDSVWFEWGPVQLRADPKPRWLESPAGKILHAMNNVGTNEAHYPFTEEELRSARERMPDCFGPNLELANYLKEHERPDEAMPYYECAVASRPDYGKGLLDLGQCLDAVGRRADAVVRWEAIEALDEEPGANRMLAWLYRGFAAEAGGDLDGALALWRRARDFDPSESDPVRLIATRCIGAQRWREAAAAAETWVRLEPNAPEAWHAAAVAAIAEESFEDAQPLFERALALAPDNVQIAHHYAILLVRCGMGDAAVQMLRRCLAIDPTHAPSQALLGELGIAPDTDAKTNPASARPGKKRSRRRR